PSTLAWPPSLPSDPTSRATRVTSPANALSWSTIVLMVSLICRISPLRPTGIFWLKSPLAMAVATFDTSRNCTVRLPAIALTESVRSFQVPPTPGTLAWPSHWPAWLHAPPRAAHFAGPARPPRGEGVELIDHRVDGVLQLEDFAFHVHGDLP